LCSRSGGRTARGDQYDQFGARTGHQYFDTFVLKFGPSDQYDQFEPANLSLWGAGGWGVVADCGRHGLCLERERSGRPERHALVSVGGSMHCCCARAILRCLLVAVLTSILWPEQLAAQSFGPGDVNVSPIGGDYDPDRPKNSPGHVTTFDAGNNSGSTVFFEFSCFSSGGVTCTDITPSSATLQTGQHITLTVTYNVGAAGGQIGADMTGEPDYYDDGIKIVTTPPTLQLVTPKVTNGDTALVHTRIPLVLATYSTTDAALDTATLVIKLGPDTVTQLVRRNSRLAEWEVDIPHQLSPGVAKALMVKICHINAGCSSITRQVLLDNTGPPIVSFGGMPLESSVAGGEVETGFATPAYFSLGAGRSAGLVYSTRQSYPRALVNVDIELTWPTGNPDQIKAVLVDSMGVRMDSLVVSSPVCQATTGRRCRVTLQGDFSGSTPGRKWLKVEVSVISGGVVKATTDSVETVIVDRRTSAYGSGWFVAGVLRLDVAGNDMLVIGPTGTATIHRGWEGVYLSPPGSRQQLVWTGTEWHLRSAFSGCGFTAKVVFDAQGKQTATIDCFGNTTRIKYATVDRIDSIMDPLNKRLSFAYNGSFKLTTITDPGGRQSKVTINASNQLVYDSLASPPATAATGAFAYTSYGGSNTVVLQSQSDALGQTTTFSYDTRRRLTHTTLPAVLSENGSTPVSAVITGRPQVLRGLDTLVSADSLFGHMRDARGFWARAALNRWGQPLRTWDSLGTITRAAYSADGLALWAEGKVADSSRVYSTYDGLGRLVKTYRIRPGGEVVRLDSLEYDASHRPNKRVNALGQVTTIGYNSAGATTISITPTNDTTDYQYTTQGLLSQVQQPGQTSWTVYTYDPTWKNLKDVTNTAGVVLATNFYDAYGRATESRRKLTVKLSGEPNIPDTIQWSRTLTGFDILNHVVSVRIERTGSCAAPCNTPPAWNNQLPVLSHFYDRLGRDTLRVSGESHIPSQNRRTRYAYDGLGRLRMRWPFADSAAVVDSFRYDVAGNLRYQWTRRGYVIEHRYDVRGRDTATIVPGVGTYRRAFAGPGDQLTRAWIDSYVDAIGGVNPEARWTYDQQGFLIADTAFVLTDTLQGARATTYLYDRYGRDTTTTDVLGTWRLRYDGIRGVLDTIITPFTDTLRWTIDTRGRRVGPYVANGGSNPDYSVVPAWDDVGKLIDLQSTHAVTVGRWQVDQTMPDIELQALWSEQQGSGGPSVNTVDSIAHDGWGRVTAVTHRKNGALLTAATYSFDAEGNIMPNSESRVYDFATTRLTQRGSFAYKYDRAGNLDSVTSGSPAWKYVYDALDRLVEVRQNGTLIARYAYDALGRRVVKKVGTGPGYVRMIYRGGEVIAEADSAGTLTFGYTRGLETDNLVAIRRYSDGSDYYVIHDPLGNVRGLSKRDGTWIASWRYDAYGTVIDSAGSSPFSVRYRWTGREYDSEIGLYFFRSRFYDPAAQRFAQEDPIGFAGGANLYAYGDGNPTNGRDPNGMKKSELFYSRESMEARQLAFMESSNPGGSSCYVNGVTITGIICGAMADWANWNWIHRGLGAVSYVPDQWTTIIEQQWQGVMSSFTATLPDFEVVVGEPEVVIGYYLDIRATEALKGTPDGTWFLPGDGFSIVTAGGGVLQGTGGLATLTATDTRLGSSNWLGELLNGPARRVYNVDVTLQIASGRYFNGRGTVTISARTGGSIWGSGLVFGYFAPFGDIRSVLWIPLHLP
jgi:RHS repeat-associated protein